MLDAAKTNVPSVAELVRARAGSGSKPGNRADPYRLGLVIEGGGMRGVVAGGMVSGLQILGLRDVFDFVCGSSAGGAAAAYFVAGQASLGASIFYEDINNDTFIDFRRVLAGRPVMNLDFLIDEVMKKIKPLDCRELSASGIDLRLVATDIDTGAPYVLRDFCEPGDIFEAMRASARIPLLAGPPVVVDRRRLMDGGLAAPVPIAVAVETKCSHVVVILTRPPTELRGRATLTDEFLIGPLMSIFLGGQTRRTYMRRATSYKETVDALIDRDGEADRQPAVLTLKLPASGLHINRLEKRREILVGGAEQAMKAVVASIGRGLPQPSEIKPYFSNGGPLS